AVKGKRTCANRSGRSRRCSGKGRRSGKRQMNVRSAIVFLALAAAVCAEELPRKIKTPRESYPNVDVIYDSVEALADTKDATGLILRGLAQIPGFCLFKIDKPGCGDSEGDCSQTDFDTELAGYRAAFLALKNYDFIDSDRV